MNSKRLKVRAVVGCCGACLIITACGRDGSLTHDDILRRDLGEILALQGSPCGDVMNFTQIELLDYRIECESGDVYRIHVSAEGNINVAGQ